MRFRFRGRRVAVVLGSALVCFAFAPAASAGGFSAAEIKLVHRINQVRASHLAPPLKLDPTLRRAAAAHSRDMIARNYFAHGAFEARLRHFGVRSHLLGENLAWSSGNTMGPAAVLQLWMSSPGHRRVLLTRGFRRIGLGMPVGPFEGYSSAVVVTADFSA